MSDLDLIRLAEDLRRRVSKLEAQDKSGGTGGSIVSIRRITSVDSPYTALATDEIIIADTDGGAITVNLPAGVAGTHYKIANVGTAGNNVTVDPNGAQTIYGSATETAYDSEVFDLHFETTEGWW